jgi:DNA-binding SARP family transcriptional activator
VLRARVLRPVPSGLPLTQPSLLSILDSPLTVVAAQTAFIVESNVARVLRAGGRFDRTAWLRLDPLDARPDHLIRSLEDSVGEVHGDEIDLLPALVSRAKTLSPEFCWALGSTLARHTPRDATIVVENPLAVSDASAVTNILVGWAGSSRDRRAVLLWHGRIPWRVRRVASVALDAHQLSTDAELVRAFIAPGKGGLSTRATARLLRLGRGRPTLVHDLLDFATRHRRELSAIEELLRAGAWGPTFIGRVTKHLLGYCSPDEREAVSLAIELGYWHPMMDRRRLVDEELTWPWLGPLEGGWVRLRPFWRRTLRRHAETMLSPQRPLAGPHLERLPSLHDQPGSRQRQGIGDAVAAAKALQPIGISVNEAASTPMEVHVPARSEEPSASDSTAPPLGPPSCHTLKVRLLGRFEVAIDDHPVDAWHGAKGLTLFKYLLTHRGRPCPRDVLMDVFWPDVSPDQARNRFHVALSALRRSLRAAEDIPIVEFRDGAYRLNPELELQVDVDDFRRLVDTGEHAQRDGDTDVAIACFGQAVTLYRGDLLAESPYDDWALLPRETLRVTYLDVLDRLAALHLAIESLGPCIAVAQLILQQDPCREDAHRLLMRCYVKQGRIHEALRQFEFCARALATTLGSGPSAATVELHRSIRTSRPE